LVQAVRMTADAVTAVILAAGLSKRMGGDGPKVLLELEGRPLLSYVIESARGGGADRIVVIVGAQKERVMSAFGHAGVEFAAQTVPLGTADAVLAGRTVLNDDEECVVLCGDAPLIRPATIRRLLSERQAAGADVAVGTAHLADPGDYGRVVRGSGNTIDRIVEKRRAEPAELAIHEVNSGAYSFRWGRVRPALERIRRRPTNHEYYLTDLVQELRTEGGRTIAVPADEPEEMLGANTSADLTAIKRALAARRELRAH